MSYRDYFDIDPENAEFVWDEEKDASNYILSKQ